MKHILKNIQETVMKYAKIISHVLRVDVEIVDSNLYRIAGTGRYGGKINEDMSGEGFVYKRVLETGQPQFIAEPGQHPLCIACPKQAQCEERLEMCTPIKLQDEIIGVIGLVCFDDCQKEHLLDNLETYREFLEQIAEFISSKAYETKEQERSLLMMGLLSQIINKVGKGVLVITKNNKIAHINDTALHQLSLSSDCVHQSIHIASTGDALLDWEEFKVVIADKTYFLMGDMIPIVPQVADYDRILIFTEIKKVKSGIYGLTNVAQDVKLAHMLGTSEVMQNLKNKISKIAVSNSTVLITGESGTGKEMIARALHTESGRHNQPFVAINCGAIPDTLLESELFGYVRGAFTGADPRGKIGKFELANRGVIFLDEISDMPLYLQVKLLRVLQERKITRIGSNQLIDIDVRVIAATNKNLNEMIGEKKFREDLYYRLNVIPIEVPPLRFRNADVEEIALQLIDKYSRLFAKQVPGINQQTLQRLQQYPWPGNVRELENTIEFMINMVDDSEVLTEETLPGNIREYSKGKSQLPDGNLIRPLAELEKEQIQRALKIYGVTTEGKKKAAGKLGIGIATLYRKLEDLNYQDDNK